MLSPQPQMPSEKSESLYKSPLQTLYYSKTRLGKYYIVVNNHCDYITLLLLYEKEKRFNQHNHP
ncbi:unknown protein [Desulfotalea psychrophila LSv54]|uniref:Uncharacterized protein n=1 Tax=Desulfotalea psychrophila (strain LSv54 / DSM 12343) TaxID=177439 RepID=Q6ARH1_DESPS|nr:unknown protein [Desulfotalea psychrophila LSv54]